MIFRADTLRYTCFLGIFETGGGGGGIFICKKQSTLRYIYIYKNNTLCVKFLHLKNPDTLRYIFIYKKKHFALRFYI